MLKALESWWSDAGRQQLDGGRIDQAIDSFRQALACNPRFAEAHANLGVALQVKGSRLEALASYHNAIQCDAKSPAAAAAQANYLACVKSHQHYLFDLLRADAQSIEEPRRFGQLLESHIGRLPPHGHSIEPDRPLRIGYLSPDFRRHSVAYFIEPVLAQHDRSSVHITCYYTCPKSDSVTQRIRSLADNWVSCEDSTPETLARRIRADRIDILVDLAGHTVGNRLLTLVRKPAPIQISYLGYPATLGLATVDYRMTDALADPAATTQPDFVEKPLQLTPSMLVYRPPFGAGGLLGSQLPAARTAGASHQGVKFGCFNSASKWSPAVLGTWAQLLQTVPGSQLVLKAGELDDPAWVAQLQPQLAAAGIETDRVVLRGREAEPLRHLECYNSIDISLDTFPYNGVTTSLESMWMGVPFVTLRGSTLPARMGVTIATNAGHPEWVADTPQDYIRIAAELALDSAHLAHLHENLRTQLEQSTLMDATGFTRGLEAGYGRIWKEWCIHAERRG